MWRFTSENFVNFDTNEVDFEALGREEFEFRKALFYRNFKKSKRAKEAYEECKHLYEKKVENGKKGGRPRKENNYGDAGSRKAPESIDHADGSASPDSTTVPKNVSTPAISTNGRRTGGPSLSQTSIPPVRQAEPDVLSLAYFGEFQNVRLSQAQYNELGIRFGNLAKLNRAIDSLSCKIENGETNPRNHYAELVKWAAYRDDISEMDAEKGSATSETFLEKNWKKAMQEIGGRL